MLNNLLVVSIVVLLAALIGSSGAWTARGCVDLDSSTFDKVVKKFRYSLVKFDTAFPYGDKHEAFTKLAQETDDDDLLFVLVGIKDYGEQDNADLGKRFNIPKEYPVIKLFTDAISHPVDFPADQSVTVENLRMFVKRNTDLYIGLPGCVQQLDDFASAFMNAADATERQRIIAAVEALQLQTDEALREQYQKSYPMYVSLMRKIEKSDKQPNTVVSEEMQRVEKLLKGKLSDAKKAELSLRINVMLSFVDGGSKQTQHAHREL